MFISSFKKGMVRGIIYIIRKVNNYERDFRKCYAYGTWSHGDD